MKKFLVILLGLILILSLSCFVACGEDDKGSETVTITASDIVINENVATANVNAVIAPSGKTAEYTSSKSDVATVDATGKITIVSCGTSEITIKVGETTKTITLTVNHIGGTATCEKEAVCTRCNHSYGEKDASNHTSDEVAYVKNDNGTYSKQRVCCGEVTDSDPGEIFVSDRQWEANPWEGGSD